MSIEIKIKFKSHCSKKLLFWHKTRQWIHKSFGTIKSQIIFRFRTIAESMEWMFVLLKNKYKTNDCTIEVKNRNDSSGKLILIYYYKWIGEDSADSNDPSLPSMTNSKKIDWILLFYLFILRCMGANDYLHLSNNMIFLFMRNSSVQYQLNFVHSFLEQANGHSTNRCDKKYSDFLHSAIWTQYRNL